MLFQKINSINILSFLVETLVVFVEVTRAFGGPRPVKWAEHPRC